MKPERTRGAAALGVLAAAVYLWTAPGRIQFPDDEIVFQTAASLWDDGDLDIPGIARRTGEPAGGRDHESSRHLAHLVTQRVEEALHLLHEQPFHRRVDRLSDGDDARPQVHTSF